MGQGMVSIDIEEPGHVGLECQATELGFHATGHGCRGRFETGAVRSSLLLNCFSLSSPVVFDMGAFSCPLGDFWLS